MNEKQIPMINDVPPKIHIFNFLKNSFPKLLAIKATMVNAEVIKSPGNTIIPISIGIIK